MSEFYAYPEDDELIDKRIKVQDRSYQDLNNKISLAKNQIEKFQQHLKSAEYNYYQLLCQKYPRIYTIGYGGYQRRHMGYFSTLEKAACYLPKDVDKFKFTIEEIDSNPDIIRKLDYNPEMIFRYKDTY